MDPAGGRADRSHVQRAEGRPAGAVVRQLPARGHAVLDADHPQCIGGRIHARPGHIAGRVRRQPAAAHLYRRAAAPRRSGPTFHGHSIGHWEGDTLVVDTIGILPQAFIALAEGAGVPNNGDMHIVERIHLQGPDILHDDLEITAPHVLTKPWKTTRIFLRKRERDFDIVEGVCIQGNYAERVNESGDAVFVPIPRQPGGNLVAPD